MLGEGGVQDLAKGGFGSRPRHVVLEKGVLERGARAKVRGVEMGWRWGGGGVEVGGGG